MTSWGGDESREGRSLTGEPEFLSGPPEGRDPQRPLWIGIGLLIAAVGIFAMLFRSSPQPIALPSTSTTSQATTAITAKDVASTTVPEVQETSQSFRESVRKAMINNCELQRVDGLQYEAFFEYERCLLAIEDNLDETCYLALKAQYFKPDEDTLNAGCEIDV